MWRLLSELIAAFESLSAGTDVVLEVAQARLLLGRLRVGRRLDCPEKPSSTSLDSMQAMLNTQVTDADISGWWAALYEAAARLDLNHDAGPEDADALRFAIAALHLAASRCGGMMFLEAEELLRPAFNKLCGFVEATAGIGSLEVGADVVLASTVCGLALADVMRPADPAAEIPPAMGAATRRLTTMAALLEAMMAAAEFDKLGLTFEARLTADSNKLCLSVLEALARLDALSSTDADWELPPIVEARAIASSYWADEEQIVAAEVAQAQFKLEGRWAAPSLKSKIADDVSWQELLDAGYEMMQGFDDVGLRSRVNVLKKASEPN